MEQGAAGRLSSLKNLGITGILEISANKVVRN